MKSNSLISKSISIFALFLLVAVVFPGSNTAAAKSEEAVQAALILKFAKFVEWPRTAFRSASSPIVIGVLGDDRLRELLTFMAIDKKASGRGLKVVDANTSSSWSSVQILFIDESESDKLSRVLTSVNGKSVLTVSEAEGFAEKGGMIFFKRVASKLHLTINTAATSEARLKVDSRLLDIATLTRH
jgi:hypothetical protein